MASNLNGAWQGAKNDFSLWSDRYEVTINRTLGVQFAFGAYEFYTGAVLAIVTAETGVGIVVGVAVMAMGIDNMKAGYDQMLTGETQRTYLNKGVAKGAEAVGFEPETAQYIAMGTEVVVSPQLTNAAKATKVSSIASSTGKAGAEKGAVLLTKELKSGNLIKDGVKKSFENHFNSNGRHADLGLNSEVMVKNTMNLIEKNIPSLQYGDNTLIGTINGIQKSFKVFVKNGEIMSINMYPGVSNRVTKGTIINYGGVKW